MPEGVARRVVRPVAHGDRPLHHGTDPLAHPLCGLGLLVPDRGEDGQHVGRGHRGHGQRPDARERIGAQTARPVLRVLGNAPAGALLLQHHGGGLLDRGHALAVALLGQRVSARPGSLAVRERHVARLGQGHQRVAAEPEHPGPAPNDQPLHPWRAIFSNIIVLGRCFGCSESFPHPSWMDGSVRSRWHSPTHDGRPKGQVRRRSARVGSSGVFRPGRQVEQCPARVVFGGVGPPCCHVCHDRCPARTGWGLDAIPGAQAGGVWQPPSPHRPAARRAGYQGGAPGALTRCRVAQGGGVMRCAGRRGRPHGAADGLALPAPAAPNR